MAAILLIEDEPGLTMTLTDRLRQEGHTVETAADGETGFRRAAGEPFDLVLLDLMLPAKSGLDVCRGLRRRGVTVPVLMLTARGRTEDKVAGLKLGADDYLTKPFEMSELLARIEALLRRGKPHAAHKGSHRFGSIEIDLRSTQVFRGGEPVRLSAKEFHLLCHFVEHAGETLSREQLLKDVWGYAQGLSTRTVDVHVAWLRQKLHDASTASPLISTVYGIGYRFDG